MKVLSAIVIPPHLSASGAVNAAIQLSIALAEYCEIEIALMSSVTAEEKLERTTLLRRKSSNIFDFTRTFLPDRFRSLFYKADIPDLIMKNNYDLVHIHNLIPALEMRRIAEAANKKNIPYVLSTHGLVEVTGKDQAYGLNWYEKLAGKLFIDLPLQKVIKSASMIFALSPADVPLLNTIDQNVKRITVIPNGVNPYYFRQPSDGQMEQVRRKFDIPYTRSGDTPICFFLANHTKNKGLEILFEAFLASSKPYVLVVGGKKRNYDYEYFVAQCRVNQRIIITDELTNEEILALFHVCDLFVFPTLADTLPLVILEAMATGTPILSTEIGGIPYQVKENCGMLVKAGDPIALKDAFEKMMSDYDRLREMGHMAHTIVKNHFDWKRSAALTYEQYALLLVSN